MAIDGVSVDEPFYFSSSGTNDEGLIQINANNFEIKHRYHGGNMILSCENAGGTAKVLATLDPDLVDIQFLGYSVDFIDISSDSDNVDVQGVGVITVDTSGGNVTIGGLANGFTGRVVHIVKRAAANTLIIEHNEAAGTQKILTSTGADVNITGYGGMTLFCYGTTWYQLAV